MPPISRLDRIYAQPEDSWRHAAARDADRLLYSTAWRRLEGVTQVTPIGGLSLIHNRLTHSLKVSQVGQRIAERLLAQNSQLVGKLDPLVVSAAGMAHDLGHPPFGHAAEKELQRILSSNDPRHAKWKLDDSFEGNAQTFRIVTKLMVRKSGLNGQPDHIGLNLTRATLAAILKYPWLRNKASARVGKIDAAHTAYYAQKWGAFNSEQYELKEALRVVSRGQKRSLEAQIMDLADDITYAIHDVEDYFRAGLIPLHEIGEGLTEARPARRAYQSDEFEKFMSYANGSLSLKSYVPYNEAEVKQWIRTHAPNVFPVRAYGDTGEDRVGLHDFASNLFQQIEQQIGIAADGSLEVPDVVQGVLELLKELTWYYVINHPHLATSQEGQRRIISNMHVWLCEWVAETYKSGDDKDQFKVSRVARNKRRLPARLVTLLELNLRGGGLPKSYSENQRISRSVVDFISGLTDVQANDLHAHLGGFSDVIGPVSWLQRG